MDTHRNRLEVGLARGLDGAVVGACLKLWLKPTKTDGSGKRKLSTTFVVHEMEDALPAAVAIRDMLIEDSNEGYGTMVPFLRDPSHGGSCATKIRWRVSMTLRVRLGIPNWPRGCIALEEAELRQ